MNAKYFVSAALSVVLLLHLGSIPIASATEISVTGNGSESVNVVSNESQQTTTVQQSNNATITNEITVTANTGNNSASNNTNGVSSITTGDVHVDTSVTNTTNTSVVTDSCGCATSPSDQITVSENGAGSINTVNNVNTTTNAVATVNNAAILNTVSVSGNTGGNTANHNSGDVTIKTGSITAKKTIVNEGINTTTVHLSDKKKQTAIALSKNGAFSMNTVFVDEKQNTEFFVSNFADIFTTLSTILETGNNDAMYNTDGDVRIITGDIRDETLISTEANTNTVILGETCAEQTVSPTPTPATSKEPTITPGSTSSESSSSSTTHSSSTTDSGSNNTAASNTSETTPSPAFLPATGSNLLFFLLLGTILMFLLGGYLRLHSGNAPGMKIAF